MQMAAMRIVSVIDLGEMKKIEEDKFIINEFFLHWWKGA